MQAHGPGDFERISDALDKQFQTIHNRAQVILGICGVLISASVVLTAGRLIGSRLGYQHRRTVAVMLVVAGILEIAAAAVVVGGVLNIRWSTRQPGADLHAWLLANLAYRDRKTAAYRVATLFLLLSMTSYQVAIAIAMMQL